MIGIKMYFARFYFFDSVRVGKAHCVLDVGAKCIVKTMGCYRLRATNVVKTTGFYRLGAKCVVKQ